jgi:phage I-like protein
VRASILNREFQHPADGWYQIEAKGNHTNREAEVVQVIDDQACETIVNRFNAAAAAGELRHGSEMLIDHEHFASEKDQESRAYGWLQELQNRADGIYGRIRWTTTGKAAVDGGDYRFFSTEYDPKDLQVVKNRAAKTGLTAVRPLRLDGLSLTNMNNNRGQKPITNRAVLGEERRRESELAAGSNTNKNTKTNMKTVLVELGLSADAAEESALVEVRKLKNRVTELTSQVTPLTQRVGALESENQTLLGEQVDALLDAHGIKSDAPVRNRLRPVLIGLKNREDRLATLVDFGFKPGEQAQAGQVQKKLQNRDTRPPTGKNGSEGTEGQAETVQATKIMNRAREIEREQKVSLATAVGMAQHELQ